jgi:hypothetical protein
MVVGSMRSIPAPAVDGGQPITCDAIDDVFFSGKSAAHQARSAA